MTAEKSGPGGRTPADLKVRSLRMARLRRQGARPWPDQDEIIPELMATIDLTEEQARFRLPIT